MDEQVLTAKEALQEDKTFKRSLGLLDATMIVAGSMIGSGIFIVSADMLKDLGSAGWLLAAWLITGFMTLTAALSYGELSSMFPKATATAAMVPVCITAKKLHPYRKPIKGL